MTNYNIDDVRSVAVLMPDMHMGNLLVSLPCVAALRERFSGRRFTLVVDEAYAELAASVGTTVNLLPLERKKIRGLAVTGTARFIGLIKRIRDARPDLAIDLEGGGASALMAFFSGAGVRASRVTSARPWAYNVRVDITQGRHKAYTYAEAAEFFGAFVDSDRLAGFRLKPSVRHMQEAEAALGGLGLSPSDAIICVHAGAGKPFKRWGAEGFAQTAVRLAAEGAAVIFIGGPGDVKITAEVMALISSKTSKIGDGGVAARNLPARDLTDKLSLGGLSALFSISRLFIGNDSGPMHLAAMSGAPVVALFGPADEARWAPLTARSAVLRGGRRCLRCTNEDCALDFVCIRSIKADAVVDAAMKLLSESRRDAPDAKNVNDDQALLAAAAPLRQAKDAR